MSLWAIIPVKPLRRGKSRLAGVLSEKERSTLNTSMLCHTLKTLTEVPEIKQILVVSRDPSALALARDYGARTVLEEGLPELNTALRRATAVARAYGSQRVLILPADLPLLEAQDLRTFINRSEKPPVCVISPDRRHEGTNALIIYPTGLIDYCYGENSYKRHCERIVRSGARLEICELASLSLDLDLPEDLELLRQQEKTLY
jgi:2-phospho-L-lactate/phosphoenolpyruvate guanylyltransferase